MANANVNATNVANESVNVANAASEVMSAKVVKVMLPTQTDNRVSFVLNTTIKTHDFVTGEIKDTNIFGMNVFAFVNVAGQFVPEIQLADALAMGNMVNPQIISLTMVNADIKFVRVHHEKGEERQYEGTYEKDCYTTEIKAITTHIQPLFANMLNKLVMERPYIVNVPTNVVSGDFNI